MKEILMFIGMAIGVLLLLFLITLAIRSFSNATTPVTLHSPKPGITCATMVTSDGAAISCWKD